MRFDFEITFDRGRIVDSSTDPGDLMDIARLAQAKAAGHEHTPIGVDGGAHQTVGDVRAIRIEARW